MRIVCRGGRDYTSEMIGPVSQENLKMRRHSRLKNWLVIVKLIFIFINKKKRQSATRS